MNDETDTTWDRAMSKHVAGQTRRADEHVRHEASVRLVDVDALVQYLFENAPTDLPPAGLAGYREALRDVALQTARFTYHHDESTGAVVAGADLTPCIQTPPIEPWEWEQLRPATPSDNQ